MNRILLADQDLEYGRALAKAVSKIHNEFQITVAQFQDNGALRSDGEADYSAYDLILIGEYSDEIIRSVKEKAMQKGNVVILTEYMVHSLIKQSEEDCKEFWYLFKYNDVSQILSDLNFLIGTLTGRQSLLKKSHAPELVAFYSVSGGTGKTVIALGTSRELVRYRDKKVLYLCFEDLPATEMLMKNHSHGRNIGDYLYFLFEKHNELLCSRLESFTVADEYGVETFWPNRGRNDLNGLKREETVRFLKIISDSCRYDYVVLDLKSDLSEDTLNLLRLCSRIVLIQKDDPISYFKFTKLERYLNFTQNQLNEHCILVVNQVKEPEVEQDGNDFRQSDKIKVTIEKDAGSFHYGPNELQFDLCNVFGTGIKKIADEILSEADRSTYES